MYVIFHEKRGGMSSGLVQEALSLILRSCNIETIDNASIEKAIEQKREKSTTFPSRITERAQYVDLQDNKIMSTIGLEIFTSVKRINLAYNTIQEFELTRYFQFPMLTHLSLANNQLVKIPWHAFSPLHNLLDLNLNKNKICTIGDASNSGLKLRSLTLRGNKIKTLEGLENMMKTLDNFDVADNLICNLEDIRLLRGEHKDVLQSLSMKGNTVANSKCYKHTVLDTFPRIRILDGGIVLPKPGERNAAQFYQYSVSNVSRFGNRFYKRSCNCPIPTDEVNKNDEIKAAVVPVNFKKTLESTVIPTIEAQNKIDEPTQAEVVKKDSPSVTATSPISIPTKLSMLPKRNTILVPNQIINVKKRVYPPPKVENKARTRVGYHKNHRKLRRARLKTKAKAAPPVSAPKKFAFSGLGPNFPSTSSNQLPLRLLGRNKQKSNFRTFANVIYRKNIQRSSRWNFMSGCSVGPSPPSEEASDNVGIEAAEKGSYDGWAVEDDGRDNDMLANVSV